jgi:hypothetical protein
MSNKLVSLLSGIPDQSTTLSLEGTLLSAVSANSLQHRPSDANKSVGLLRTTPLYGTRRFTRVHIWPLNRDKCLQFISFKRISSRSIVILSCYQPLSFPSCLFHSVFPTKTLYSFLVSHKPATCSAHLIFLVLITIIINVEGYKF